MDFSVVPRHSLVGKILRFPLRLIPPNAKLRILQGKFKGKRWIAGSFVPGCWLGSYEYEKRVLFEKTIESGSIVFDIGAHVGFYTLLASVLVGPRGKVFAFEPSPRNLHYLREHLRLNRITNVEVVEVAVANASGTAFFEESPPGSKGGLARISKHGQLVVKTAGLDEEVARGALPIPHYMKIDVEGAEMLVLSGAKSILASAQPTVFLATHGVSLHQRCSEFLKSLGYELRPVVGSDLEETDEILAYQGGVKGSTRLASILEATKGVKGRVSLCCCP